MQGERVTSIKGNKAIRACMSAIGLHSALLLGVVTAATGCGGESSSTQLAAAASTFVQLPAEGPGYYTITTPSRLWGHPTVIENMKQLGSDWKLLQFADAWGRIGVNDISFQDGSQMPPHSSHREGKDIDLRPMRTDGAEVPTQVADSKYSREGTAALIERAHSVFDLRIIFFNDPKLYGSGDASCAAPDVDGKRVSYVKCWSGHHNHLHVSSL